MKQKKMTQICAVELRAHKNIGHRGHLFTDANIGELKMMLNSFDTCRERHVRPDVQSIVSEAR